MYRLYNYVLNLNLMKINKLPIFIFYLMDFKQILIDSRNKVTRKKTGWYLDFFIVLFH